MAPMPALSLRPQLLPLWLLATLCSGSLLTQSLAYAAPTVEERVAAVTNMITAFRAGDIPTFLTYYTEDAVYKYEGTPSIPWAGSFHGQDGLLQELDKYYQYFAGEPLDIDIFSSATTGRVIVNFIANVTVLSSGATFQEQCFVRFALNDDLKIYESVESSNALKEYEEALALSYPVGGTCEPGSSSPNQCFNADGSRFVCCAGQCPSAPTSLASCADPRAV